MVSFIKRLLDKTTKMSPSFSCLCLDLCNDVFFTSEAGINGLKRNPEVFDTKLLV